METALLASGLAIFAYALVARRLADGIVTGPMFFLGFGLALNGFGLARISDAEPVLHVLAEVTLVVVLFADAAIIDVRALRWRLVWPGRMLLAGLPMTILAGIGAGMLLLPDWPFWEAALLAAILAPTDAALGQAVVTNPALPEPVREALSAESGVNDGLALRAVLMFGCLAIAVLAVLVSALLHGVTATPGARWFARRLQVSGVLPTGSAERKRT